MNGPGPGGPSRGQAHGVAPAATHAPGPLLTPESGNAVTNAAADVVNRTAAPFQNLAAPNVSTFAKAQGVVGAAAGIASAPTDFLNDAFARATDSIATALPSFPAATVGMLVVGMPHTHQHPPSLIPPAPPIPLPAIGTILTGCPSVLISGVPAARAGDFGIAPTCGSFTPVFEIYTGSSKVFIGGSRAARMLDVTKQCAPGKPPAAGAAKAAGAASKAGKAAAAASKVMGGLGKLSMAMGVVGAGKKIVDTQAAADAAQAAADAADDASDESAAAAAEASAAAASAAAEASAAILEAAMMGANLAMDAVKTSMGGMLGKDPGAPTCFGAVMLGSPVVLIGGFPMPSWSEIAKGLKKLVAALARGRRGGAGRGRLFCLKCM